jgi:hypothetical protein
LKVMKGRFDPFSPPPNCEKKRARRASLSVGPGSGSDPGRKKTHILFNKNHLKFNKNEYFPCFSDLIFDTIYS